MRWLAGLVGCVLLFGVAPAWAQCPGDCNGNGAVTIEELVSAVRIALAQASLDSCAAADANDDGRVTVDDLVRAVNAALRGCPATPTPTASASAAVTHSATPTTTLAVPTDTPSVTVPPTPTSTELATTTPTETAMPTATGSNTPDVSGTPTPSASPTPTFSATMVSATATFSATGAATATPIASATSTETGVPPVDTATQTRTATGTVASTITPTDTATRTGTPTRTSTAVPNATHTATVSPTRTATATRTASPSATLTSTQSRTPSATRTATSTPTGGPLGTRRFSLDPATSAFIAVLGPGMQVTETGFTGFLDLQAGAPNALNGRALINVPSSSTYLQLKSGTNLICIRPLVPASDVGIVDCDGGTNLGVTISQDHRIGVVGSGGFTEGNCTSAGGTVEPPGFPHPQVCNGPLTVAPSASGDSGPGAVLIAPDPTFNVNGLPAEVSFQIGDACPGDGTGPGFTDVLPLISRNVRTEILHANNTDSPLIYTDAGESFSCPAWTQENGPGRLFLSFPTLHGAVGTGADLINVFLFDD